MHEEEAARHRRLAAGVSLAVGAGLLGLKFFAYRLTGSTAVLSDALESIANVVAAIFALGGVIFAGRPADRNHPYGHGKIEFLSAAFEGGLIVFAALVVVFEAVQSLLRGPELRQLDLGLLLVLACGVVNALLGIFLVRSGRRLQSEALVADGQHVLSDFYTSAGVVVGLLLVRWTGIAWFDPLVAALVGFRLAWTGWRLVRRASGGLLDEEDEQLVARLVRSFDSEREDGLVRVHSLRAIRAGRFHHVDVHLVVPQFWSVERAHGLADRVEQRVMRAAALDGEISIHLDPCGADYCAGCDVEPCPIRREPYAGRAPLSVEEAVAPDPPPRR